MMSHGAWAQRWLLSTLRLFGCTLRGRNRAGTSPKGLQCSPKHTKGDSKSLFQIFPALRHIPGTFPALREFIRIYSKVPYLFETRLKLETPIAGVVPIIPVGGGAPLY